MAQGIHMGRAGTNTKRGSPASFRASLRNLEQVAQESSDAIRDVTQAIETTGRITYKGRTYLIVDELTGLPSHLVGK